MLNSINVLKVQEFELNFFSPNNNTFFFIENKKSNGEKKRTNRDSKINQNKRINDRVHRTPLFIANEG